MAQTYATADLLASYIADEIYKALGFSPRVWFRRFIDPALQQPTSRFARICATFDQDVAELGFPEAARRFLPNFVQDIRTRGAENIPNSGPLVVAANHPGTVDSLAIAAHIPRDDLKIVAGNIPFLKIMPATQNHMIHASLDTHDRMMVLRKAIRHLNSGGALLIFPSGGIDPEPEHMPGAEAQIDTWSKSIEIFLKKVPQTHFLAAIVSGVLAPQFIRHPFTLLRKNRRDKQRISEFVQVIQQVVRPGKLALSPRISFDQPLTPDLVAENGEPPNLIGHLADRAKRLLRDHMGWETNQSRS